MTKIQIILLFTSLSSLDENQKTRLCEIVRDAYARQFGCQPRMVQATLLNGKSSNCKSDIMLSIASDQKRLNEGALRSEMKKEIANNLRLLFPKDMGFSGNIATQDGEMPVPQEAPAGKADAQETEMDSAKRAQDSEMDYTKRAQLYQAVEPEYSFEMVKLPANTLEQIDQALARIELEREVFEEWGLYAIMPNPVSAMSFYGPPGTGKTLAASAIANRLHKKLIRASYADIESKYHGEGPKNVCAIFLAAEQQDAVLFIDEADSLLSKRLTNVTQGSEQAINSMRSQLLICLEKFHGIVIFATNLVVNYDRAFLSRLINVPFELPDAQMRTEIWDSHLRPVEGGKVRICIPLADDVDTAALGRDYPVCGRNIRNAVVNACVETRRKNLPRVTQECLCKAIANEILRNDAATNAQDHTALQPGVSDAARGALKPALESLKDAAKTVKSSVAEGDGGE